MVAKNDEDIIPTQFLKKNFDLTEKVNEEFLDLIKDAFKSDVSVVGITFLINNPEDESEKELISFNHRNDKEQKNNEVIIDFFNPTSFEKIKKIL